MTNFVGVQDDATPNTAVLGLTRTGLGSEVAKECLVDLMKTYRGETWNGASVGLMTRVLKKLCRANHVSHDLLSSDPVSNFIPT